MLDASESNAPSEVVDRLRQAINQHDIDALTACFDAGYQSDFPAHPDRAFQGHDQMRGNWTQIFGAVPDLQAELLRSVSQGDTIWAEWDWHGTRRDGAAFAMRGVTVQGVKHGQIAWIRLYMEPVEVAGAGVETAVRTVTSTPARA